MRYAFWLERFKNWVQSFCRMGRKGKTIVTLNKGTVIDKVKGIKVWVSREDVFFEKDNIVYQIFKEIIVSTDPRDTIESSNYVKGACLYLDSIRISDTKEKVPRDVALRIKEEITPFLDEIAKNSIYYFKWE